MSLRLSDLIKQFNLKIEIGEFPGGPVVRTAVSLLKARVWSLVGDLGSYKSCGEVKKKMRLTKHCQLFVVTLVLIKFSVICFNFPFAEDLFIYFWLCWVFAACRLSLIAASGGYSSCGAQASHCSGFSCCGALALEYTGFSGCSTQVLECWLSSYGARA